MNYIWNELKNVFFPYIFSSGIITLVFTVSGIYGPEMTWWAPWVVTFLAAYATYIIWIIVRTIWLTFWRKFQKPVD